MKSRFSLAVLPLVLACALGSGAAHAQNQPVQLDQGQCTNNAVPVWVTNPSGANGAWYCSSSPAGRSEPAPPGGGMSTTAGNATSAALNALAGAGSLTTNKLTFTGLGATTTIGANLDVGLNSGLQIIAPLQGTARLDNLVTMENDSVNGGGVCGNAATRYRDSVIHYERGAIGYSNVATGCTGGFFPNTLYAEIGSQRAADPDDTSFAVVNTHTSGATNFSGLSYKLLEARGDTGKIYMRQSNSAIRFNMDPELPGLILNGNTTAPVNTLDIAGGGGVAVGSYAGVNTAPGNSVIVSGGIGIGSATTPNSKKLVVVGGSGVHVDRAGTFGATGNLFTVESTTNTDGMRYTLNGVGATVVSFNSTDKGVLNTDGTKLTIKTGSADPTAGTAVITAATAGVTLNVIPTSAGAGGLNVCVDTSGVLYKKASCP